MHKRLIPITLGALALGCALAWLAKPRIGMGASPEERVERDAHVTLRPDATNHGFDALPGRSKDDGTLTSSFEKFSSAEMKNFLNTLKSNTGMLARWDPEQYQLFDAALAHWYEKDPEAAIRWALAWTNESNRTHLLERFIGIEGDKDIDQGLALLDRLESMSGQKLTPPFSMVEKSMLADAAAFLKVMAKFDDYHRATTGYAPDFDFKTAIEGLIGIQEKARKEGGESSGLPVSNIISEWTKRDPQAALEWLRASDVPKDGWAQFAEGYTAVAGLNELGGFAAELHRHDQGDYKKVWSLLSGRDKKAAVQGFLTDVSAGGDSAPYASGLFLESITSGDGYDNSNPNHDTREMLLKMIPPDARLAMLTEQHRLNSSANTRDYLGKQIAATMRDLGHSEADIKAAVPVSPHAGSTRVTTTPLPPR